MNEWPEARIATILRELGEERHARSIAREIVRRRPLDDHGGARRGDPRGRAARLPLRPRPSRQAHASRRSASPSTTSSTRSTGLLPAAWDLLRDRRPPGGDLRSTRWRTAASSASSPTSPTRLRVPARAPGLRLRSRARGGARSPRPRREARRARSSATRARARPVCASPASSRRRRSGHRRRKASPIDAGRDASRPQRRRTGPSSRGARSAAASAGTRRRASGVHAPHVPTRRRRCRRGSSRSPSADGRRRLRARRLGPRRPAHARPAVDRPRSPPCWSGIVALNVIDAQLQRHLEHGRPPGGRSSSGRTPPLRRRSPPPRASSDAGADARRQARPDRARARARSATSRPAPKDAALAAKRLRVRRDHVGAARRPQRPPATPTATTTVARPPRRPRTPTVTTATDPTARPRPTRPRRRRRPRRDVTPTTTTDPASGTATGAVSTPIAGSGSMIERRIGLLFASFLLLLVLGIGRAAWVQGVQGGGLSADAQSQQIADRRGAWAPRIDPRPQGQAS